MTIFLAYCSVIYELLLAQTLTTLFSNTVLRYSMTMGLYISAMGLGALIFSRISQRINRVHFISIELALSILGGLAPFLLMGLESLFWVQKVTPTLSHYVLLILSHMLVVVIGLLSGFELPFLMDMAKNHAASTANNLNSSLAVLSVDYLGTLLGIVLFPLVLLSQFSIFEIGLMTGIINLGMGLFAAVMFVGARWFIAPVIASVLALYTYLYVAMDSVETLVTLAYQSEQGLKF